jgi:hypothetical protein
LSNGKAYDSLKLRREAYVWSLSHRPGRQTKPVRK